MSDINCAPMLKFVSISEGDCTIFIIVHLVFGEIQLNNKDDSANRAKWLQSTNVSDRGDGPVPCQIQIKSGTA